MALLQFLRKYFRTFLHSVPYQTEGMSQGIYLLIVNILVEPSEFEKEDNFVGIIFINSISPVTENQFSVNTVFPIPGLPITKMLRGNSPFVSLFHCLDKINLQSFLNILRLKEFPYKRRRFRVFPFLQENYAELVQYG